MKKMKIPLMLIITFGLFFVLKFFYFETKLIKFEYSGFGDTICASLNGRIIERNIFGDKALENVKASFVGINKCKNNENDTILRYFSKYFPQKNTCYTDKIGEFNMGFIFSDNITITLTKIGYDTLIIRNYSSIPDQYSQFEVVLNTGNSKKIEIIKDSKK